MSVFDRYSLTNLRRVLQNPRLATRELSRLRRDVGRLGLRLNTAYHSRWPHEGHDLMAAEWDTLIILDGCRYDLFEDHHEEFVDSAQSYELCSVTSRGSHSREFIERNFRGDTHLDTVYVTSNPFVSEDDETRFHALENLFLTAWDSELNTVPPDAVTEAAIEAHARYPNKRLIVHYMQPHFPFIGERGRELEHRGLYPDDAVAAGRSVDTDPDVDTDYTRIWARLEVGDIDPDFVWDLYEENLNMVIPHVAKLLRSVDGKSVITADHGNLFGERQRPIPVRGYGHPERIHVPELLTVPWLELHAETRRTVTADESVSATETDEIVDKTVTERLKHLGYHE